MSAEQNQRDHAQAAEKFIELANKLAADGIAMNMVSAALMTASGT